MDDPIVTCDICLRPCSSRLPFNCSICARTALYEPRIRLAEALLENEAAGQEVERSIGATKTTTSKHAPTTKNKSQDINPAWTIERIHAEQAAAKERTQQTLDHTDVLRQETHSLKAEVAERKSILLRRRSALKSATDELLQRKVVAIEPVEKGVKRMEHRWDAMHLKTMESRVFLCREAAQLYGLQQRKRKRGGLGRDIYFIGGMPIADLRDLNSRVSSFPNPYRKLICPRCFSSTSHHFDNKSRESCAPRLPLPISPPSRRNHGLSSRLSITNHFLTQLLLFLS